MERPPQTERPFVDCAERLRFDGQRSAADRNQRMSKLLFHIERQTVHRKIANDKTREGVHISVRQSHRRDGNAREIDDTP